MLLLMSESNTLRGLDGARKKHLTIQKTIFAQVQKTLTTESIKVLFKVNERLVLDI